MSKSLVSKSHRIGVLVKRDLTVTYVFLLWPDPESPFLDPPLGHGQLKVLSSYRPARTTFNIYIIRCDLTAGHKRALQFLDPVDELSKRESGAASWQTSARRRRGFGAAEISQGRRTAADGCAEVGSPRKMHHIDFSWVSREVGKSGLSPPFRVQPSESVHPTKVQVGSIDRSADGLWTSARTKSRAQ